MNPWIKQNILAIYSSLPLCKCVQNALCWIINVMLMGHCRGHCVIALSYWLSSQLIYIYSIYRCAHTLMFTWGGSLVVETEKKVAIGLVMSACRLVGSPLRSLTKISLFLSNGFPSNLEATCMVYQMTNLKDCGNLLTFPFALPWGWTTTTFAVIALGFLLMLIITFWVMISVCPNTCKTYSKPMNLSSVLAYSRAQLRSWTL